MATSRIDELIAVLEPAFRGSTEGISSAVKPANTADATERAAVTEQGTKAAGDNERVILAALPSVAPPAGAFDAEQASGTSAAAVTGSGELGRLTTELELLRRATSQQTETLQGTTQALIESLLGTKSSSAAGGVASTAGKVLSNSLGSLFGISPIISGVLSLFGVGKHDETPPALTEYSLPKAVKQDIGVAPDNAFTAASYGENGLPKTEAAPASASSTIQVNVQVNAMDSRSFLDRSDDIARAVKEAMLHSHSINDVVVDL